MTAITETTTRKTVRPIPVEVAFRYAPVRAGGEAPSREGVARLEIMPDDIETLGTDIGILKLMQRCADTVIDQAAVAIEEIVSVGIGGGAFIDIDFMRERNGRRAA